ncbi:hypothetical protein [Streptomyces sp. NPDC000880]
MRAHVLLGVWNGAGRRRMVPSRATRRPALAGRTSTGTGTAMAVGVGEVEYRAVEPGLTAEVEQGTTRHTVTTVLRLRLRLPEDHD